MEKNNEAPRIMIVMPEPRVFRDFTEYSNVVNPTMQAVSLSSGTPQFDHAEYPETGGIVRYYKDFKYPEKGFAFFSAIYACNFSKREAVVWLKILSKHKVISLLFGRKKALNDLLDGYCNIANLMLSRFYYKDEYYCDFSKQIRAFINGFLDNYGVPHDNTAMIIATMFEHDNAYRYRVQDLALETSKEKLAKDFPKEMKRLLKTYSEREESTDMRLKLESITRIIKLGWYIPSFRRAIRAGLRAMDWEKFIPDEADKHFMLIRHDYNCFGRTIEDRWKEWMKIYENNPPKLIYQFSTPKEREVQKEKTDRLMKIK